MLIHRIAVTCLFAGVAMTSYAGQAFAQTCRWDGNGPVCDGECKEGETERYRADLFNQGAQTLPSVNAFGGPCILGTKAYCCKTPGTSCRWDGTAPFCAGECQSGETEVPSPAGPPGSSCWTGKKRYCCHSTGSVGTGSQHLVSATVKGIIYGITPDDHLVWYLHEGRDDGTFRWGSAAARTVGTGWSFAEVFSGGDGVIYGITPLVKAILPVGIGPGMKGHSASGGDLMWYRHDGRSDGTFNWGPNSGKRVGVGWGGLKEVFSGGDGVIYTITAGGDLMWYRHEGNDGAFKWRANSGTKVGVGWGGFKRVFSGGGGVIYAITPNGDLMWYRHDGRNDGAFRWGFDTGKKVGVGWGDLRQAFSGGDGVIYTITAGGDLMWYRHEGRNDGSFRWAPRSGTKVGVGWSQAGLKQVFAD